MKKNIMGIFIVVICTIFTSIGQYFFKMGSVNFAWDFFSLITNYAMIIGFLFYGVGSILLIAAFRYGDLSLLYPFISLTFIWVIIISSFVFGEPINGFKIGSVILIILGVIFIGAGDKSV